MSLEALKIRITSDVQEKLFPDNSFYNGAQSDTGIGIDQSEVVIPQDEDGEADYVINPTLFPLQTVVNEDKKKSYEADLIATKPELVTDLNQMLVSYDKRAVKLRKHINTLETRMASRILHAWGATRGDFIRQTTGTATRPATAPGATGNRRKATKSDFLFYMTLFNDLNVPMDGRRVVVTPQLYEDVLAILEDMGKGAEYGKGLIEKGAVGMIYTFNVYVRSEGPIYTEAAIPAKKPLGAATAPTDNRAAIFYHPMFVRYIKGTVAPYINPNRGEYLGGTMNVALRGGGTVSRLSQIGVAALVEDNA